MNKSTVYLSVHEHVSICARRIGTSKVSRTTRRSSAVSFADVIVSNTGNRLVVKTEPAKPNRSDGMRKHKRKHKHKHDKRTMVFVQRYIFSLQSVTHSLPNFYNTFQKTLILPMSSDFLNLFLKHMYELCFPFRLEKKGELVSRCLRMPSSIFIQQCQVQRLVFTDYHLKSNDSADQKRSTTSSFLTEQLSKNVFDVLSV